MKIIIDTDKNTLTISYKVGKGIAKREGLGYANIPEVIYFVTEKLVNIHDYEPNSYVGNKKEAKELLKLVGAIYKKRV